MIPVEVGCAVICREEKILIAQRKPEDSLGGYWEFPGGKREEGESIEECLIREVTEELAVTIRPRRFLRKASYKYSDKKVTLFFYLCDWVSGEPACIDCADFRFVLPEELRNFKFPPGDDAMITELIRTGLRF